MIGFAHNLMLAAEGSGGLLTWGLWMAGMLVVVMLSGWIFMRVRQWMRGQNSALQPTDFTLDSMEAMRLTGQITEEEFHELRKGFMKDVLGDETQAETPAETPAQTPETPDEPTCETCEKPE